MIYQSEPVGRPSESDRYNRGGPPPSRDDRSREREPRDSRDRYVERERVDRDRDLERDRYDNRDRVRDSRDYPSKDYDRRGDRDYYRADYKDSHYSNVSSSARPPAADYRDSRAAPAPYNDRDRSYPEKDRYYSERDRDYDRPPERFPERDRFERDPAPRGRPVERDSYRAPPPPIPSSSAPLHVRSSHSLERERATREREFNQRKDPVTGEYIRQNAPEYEDNNQLYLSNINEQASPEDILQAFSQFGTIIDKHINASRQSKAIVGSMFIHYSNVQEAWHAIRTMRGEMGSFKHPRTGEKLPLAKTPAGLFIKYAENKAPPPKP